LPRLARTQWKPGSGLLTVTEAPLRNAAVRAARPCTTRFPVEHGTPCATTIQGCPAAVTTPQLVAARAFAAPAVSASADSATPTANLAKYLVDPSIR
jgi:hypothetical protein